MIGPRTRATDSATPPTRQMDQAGEEAAGADDDRVQLRDRVGDGGWMVTGGSSQMRLIGRPSV